MIVEQAVHFPATQFNKWTGQNESYTHSYLLKLMPSFALLNQFFAQNVCLQYIRYKVGIKLDNDVANFCKLTKIFNPSAVVKNVVAPYGQQIISSHCDTVEFGKK